MENQIPVMGRLTADPELRYTQNGLAVANFTIASNQRIFDKKSNEWKDGEPTFLRAVAWKEMAERIASVLHKGTRVIAYGRLAQKSYETKEGEKRTYVELTVEDIGASLKFGSSAGGGQAQAAVQDEPWGAPQAQQRPQAQQSGGDVWNTPGSYSDDTPF